MKRLLVPALIVAFAALGASAGFLFGDYLYDHPPTPAGVEAVDIGEPVPDFALPDVDGRERRLSEWHGQLVIANYWASWCPPCVEEMPMLDAYAHRHGNRGVVVLGIAEDDAEAVGDFLQRHPVGFPILLGVHGQLAGSSIQLGNSRRVLPFTALIGRDGRLLERRAGAIDEALLDGWLARHSPD